MLAIPNAPITTIHPKRLPDFTISLSAPYAGANVLGSCTKQKGENKKAFTFPERNVKAETATCPISSIAKEPVSSRGETRLLAYGFGPTSSPSRPDPLARSGQWPLRVRSRLQRRDRVRIARTSVGLPTNKITYQRTVGESRIATRRCQINIGRWMFGVESWMLNVQHSTSNSQRAGSCRCQSPMTVTITWRWRSRTSHSR